jgi:hypothetical protein
LQKGEKLMSIEEKKKARDDWNFKNKIENFLDFNFWKVPEQYKIEDLMTEFNNNNETK